MSNSTNNLAVTAAPSSTNSTVSLPSLVGGSSVSSISIDPSAVISLDDGTPVKLYVDRFQKAHHEALEKITDWLVETQKAELAKGYMCS